MYVFIQNIGTIEFTPNSTVRPVLQLTHTPSGVLRPLSDQGQTTFIIEDGSKLMSRQGHGSGAYFN